KKVPFAGREETDVAADLADLLRQFGHSQVDFTPARLSGGQTNCRASPHGLVTPAAVRKLGEMVLLDRIRCAGDSMRECFDAWVCRNGWEWRNGWEF
ncbi:hypothetical protein AB0419_32730, partial [Streptomyces sp. NPDC088360]